MPVDPYGYEEPIADQALLFDPYGDEPWYVDPLNRGLDVLGAWASRSPYVSPDDPRHRPNQTTVYQHPQGAPGPQLAPGVARQSQQANVSVPTDFLKWGLILGGAVFFGMLFGQRKR